MANKGKSRVSQKSQRGGVVRRNGTSENPDGTTAAAPDPRVEDWSTKNRRRILLIGQKFNQGLSPDEERELGTLQAEADRYLDEVVPLPFDHLRRLEQQMGLPAADPAASDNGHPGLG
jgi:hypothetical protein